MNNLIPTKYALNIQTALCGEGMTTRICSWGKPPIVPYDQDGFTLERILKSELEYTMPAEVLKRIERLEVHTPVNCYLIAHEIKELEPPSSRFEISKDMVNTLSKVLPMLASILCSVVALLGTVVGMVVGLCAALVMAVALADPIVIAVLPDGTWLEIAKWYD